MASFFHPFSSPSPVYQTWICGRFLKPDLLDVQACHFLELAMMHAPHGRAGRGLMSLVFVVVFHFFLLFLFSFE